MSTSIGKPIVLNGIAGSLYGSDDSRPPLVLLHGLTFDRRIWNPVIAELQSLDPIRRLLAVDLPGHGESETIPSYSMDSVTDALHAALQAGGFDEPVLVGHSISAVIASVYGARFSTDRIVNVDQPLQTAPFSHMLRSMVEQLRSPAFPAIWSEIALSFHTELLPEPGRVLIEETSKPHQEIVLGYWREVLELSTDELGALITSTLDSLRERNVPYLVVAGREPESGYADWLTEQLPQATIVVFPNSGHFPFLADPQRFARQALAEE